MKKRHTLAFPLIVLMLAGFLLSASGQDQPTKKESPFWWQVELRISVNGTYNYRVNNKGFEGNYSFIAIVLGTMEEDEDDFIFLQAYQEIQGNKWREVVFNGTGRIGTELGGKIKPEATVNYVFHEKGVLSFDFDFKSIQVPFVSAVFPKPVKSLQLPESAGDDSVYAKINYNKGIVGGSNRVTLAGKDIYKKNKKEINLVFQWKWKEENNGTNENTSWKNTHRVETKLKIIRLMKKDDTKDFD
jgi:hypothetical protein